MAINLDQNLIKQMRECLQTDTPLGNNHFRIQIEQMHGRTVGFSKWGRPKKPTDEGDKECMNPAGQPPLEGV